MGGQNGNRQGTFHSGMAVVCTPLPCQACLFVVWAGEWLKQVMDEAAGGEAATAAEVQEATETDEVAPASPLACSSAPDPHRPVAVTFGCCPFHFKPPPPQ